MPVTVRQKGYRPRPEPPKPPDADEPKPKPKPDHIDVQMVSSRVFMMMASRLDHEVVSIGPKDFDWSEEHANLLQRLSRMESSFLSIAKSGDDFNKFNKKTLYLTTEEIRA